MSGHCTGIFNAVTQQVIQPWYATSMALQYSLVSTPNHCVAALRGAFVGNATSAESFQPSEHSAHTTCHIPAFLFAEESSKP